MSGSRDGWGHGMGRIRSEEDWVTWRWKLVYGVCANRVDFETCVELEIMECR
jgi:hypothetical protein